MIYIEIRKPNDINFLFTFNGKLKAAHVILQTLVIFYTCIVSVPKMTFLNVLDCMFVIFFPVLSTSSMVISVCSKTSHQFIVYETGILFSMIMAFAVIHLCRSKIFLTKNNVRSLSDLFMYSQSECIECYFAPLAIILSQILCLALFFYKENTSNLDSLELKVNNNKCSCENISNKFSCTQCNIKSKQKEGLSEEFYISNGNKLEHLNVRENIHIEDKTLNEIEYSSSSIDIENKAPMDSEEKFSEVVSSNERRKIKPPPRLCRVPSNSSNQNIELDSTNSEIASHNDTCLSTLDTEDDISLSIIRMDTSESIISELSLTDSKQFVNTLYTDSSSSQNTNITVHKSPNTSVQFSMDLTPEKTELFSSKVINLTDNESSSQTIDYSPSQCKYVHTLKTANLIWKKSDLENQVNEMKLIEDSHIKEAFLNAVTIFEKENSEFTNWLSTKPNSSEEFYTEFLKYVDDIYRQDVKKILSKLNERIVKCSSKSKLKGTREDRKFEGKILRNTQIDKSKNSLDISWRDSKFNTEIHGTCLFDFENLLKEIQKLNVTLRNLRKASKNLSMGELNGFSVAMNKLKEQYNELFTEFKERAKLEEELENSWLAENQGKCEPSLADETETEWKKAQLTQKDSNLDTLSESKVHIQSKKSITLNQLERTRRCSFYGENDLFENKIFNNNIENLGNSCESLLASKAFQSEFNNDQYNDDGVSEKSNTFEKTLSKRRSSPISIKCSTSSAGVFEKIDEAPEIKELSKREFEIDCQNQINEEIKVGCDLLRELNLELIALLDVKQNDGV